MVSIQEIFTQFAKFGDSKSDGKSITLTQSDKWMKQAGVIGKKITTTDTGICYNKFKSRNLSYTEYDKYLKELAKYKSVDYEEIVAKMVSCGAPGMSNATQAVMTGAVERLTDTSKYTGAHKERFDAAGKGKGIDGRENRTDNSGYVTGYKDKDTYDKTHK